MNATVLYSKIANSALPTEIQGEEGNLTLDRINIIRKVTYSPRLAPAMGKGPEPVPEDLSVVADKDEYYYEVAEFINLVLSGKRESEINSLDNSLITLEIIETFSTVMKKLFHYDGNPFSSRRKKGYLYFYYLCVLNCLGCTYIIQYPI